MTAPDPAAPAPEVDTAAARLCTWLAELGGRSTYPPGGRLTDDVAVVLAALDAARAEVERLRIEEALTEELRVGRIAWKLTRDETAAVREELAAATAMPAGKRRYAEDDGIQALRMRVRGLANMWEHAVGRAETAEAELAAALDIREPQGVPLSRAQRDANTIASVTTRAATNLRRAEQAEAEIERLRDVQLRQRERAEAAEAALAAARAEVEQIRSAFIHAENLRVTAEARREDAEDDAAAARAVIGRVEAYVAEWIEDRARADDVTQHLLYLRAALCPPAPPPAATDYLLDLQAELDELERTDPAVRAAADSYDAMVPLVLRPTGVDTVLCNEPADAPIHEPQDLTPEQIIDIAAQIARTPLNPAGAGPADGKPATTPAPGTHDPGAGPPDEASR